MEYLAHTNEKLIDHLLFTSELAALNGHSFGHEKVCRQLGLLHDIGKRTENFQLVLKQHLSKQDHAIVAGVFYQLFGLNDNTWLKEHMALIMASHHSELYNDAPDFMKKYFEESLFYKTGAGAQKTTRDNQKRVTATKDEFEDICEFVKEHNLLLNITEEDHFDTSLMSENEKMFYTRMLLSCLVDADYCATAEHYDPGYLDRSINKLYPSTQLVNLAGFRQNIIEKAKGSPMDKLRNEVFESCSAMGKDPSSFFTLTAPTGTGKTLALLEFALRNAKAFNKDRIIIVLPYLSIIDQNSEIYKEILGSDNVLIDDSQTEYTDATRILSDRWSAPVVITTSVKFFETLFSCKATELRRLHNLANSVIVFDECQTLPANLLNSSIEALQSLTKYYKSTVLFSTATKPSYEERNLRKEDKGLLISDMQWNAKEITADVSKLFDAYSKIKNTEIVAGSKIQPYSVDDLLNYFDKENAALYVCNTVEHANTLYGAACERYGKDKCLILTSRFCAKDKLAIINDINNRLKKEEFVRVVSTQCIEVGVDFDFPAATREYAPLDSILQTLGRVNRNGRFAGKFLIYMPEQHGEKDYPGSGYKFAGDQSCRLLSLNQYNIYDTALMNAYYKQWFHSSNGRELPALYDAEANDNYREVEANYNVIENKDQYIFIVPPHTGELPEDIIKDIQDNSFVITKRMMKKLAPYTISICASRSFNPKSVADQLSFKMGTQQVYTNWFLLRDASFYTEHGFDKNK